MTMSADTLVQNTKAVASTASANMWAFRKQLDQFANSTFPIDLRMYDGLKEWLRTEQGDDHTQRNSSEYADLTATRLLNAPQYEDAVLPEIPDWRGVDTFAVGPHLDRFKALIDDYFPSQAQLTAVIGALGGLEPPGPAHVAVLVAEAEVVLRDMAGSKMRSTLAFYSKAPAGAADAAANDVVVLRGAERTFQTMDNRMKDEAFDIRVLGIKAGVLAGQMATYMTAKHRAIGAIDEYLTAYLAELQAPYLIADKDKQIETTLLGNRIQTVMDQNGMTAMVRDKMAAYFSAKHGYEESAFDFQKALSKHSDTFRNLVVATMTDASKNISALESAAADASARQAAAAVSSLGSVLTSAINYFG